MIRLVACLVCTLGVASTAPAIPVRHDPLEGRKKGPADSVKRLSLDERPGQYRITAKTEVFVNGRPCKYEEVPADAVILRMEIVSPEDREILKIYFQSKTGPAGGRTDPAGRSRPPAK
jgi:hypothetical protein